MRSPPARTPPKPFRAVFGSAAEAPLFDRVKACMAGYISPILVDAVLGKAMQTRGVTPSALADAAMDGIVEESMIGLRLFVDAERLPGLMLELAEILEGNHR